MLLCPACRHQFRTSLNQFKARYNPTQPSTRLISTSTTVRQQARQQPQSQSQPESQHIPSNIRRTFPTRDLGAFYNDLLSSSSSSVSASTSNSSSTTSIDNVGGSNSSSSDKSNTLPDWVLTQSRDRPEIISRASQLFGSIQGSGYVSSNSELSETSWQNINGVPVPPRPTEPDNCCMSGCVNCVWDDYREDVEQWAGRIREARMRSKSSQGESGSERGMGRVEGGVQPAQARGVDRPEVSASSLSMDEDGGGSESLWTAPGPGSSSASSDGSADDELFAEIPIGIREFMANEKRIRERKKRRRERGENAMAGVEVV